MNMRTRIYLKIEDHGYNGDFYVCDSDDMPFRADNLAIATKLACNKWLYNFDNLWRECTLKEITESSFTFTITPTRGPSETETHSIKYFGPADMFTAAYKHSNTVNHDYVDKYEHLENLCRAGDPRVRRSNRSGMVMFTVCFPRYRKNGEWWSGENNMLSTDSELAAEQFEYAFADDATQKAICERNREVMTSSFLKSLDDVISV